MLRLGVELEVVGARHGRGETLASGRVERPGTYSAELKFDAPGSRIVTLRIEAPETRYAQTLRLDVMKRAWQG